jgi:hypothetical protein
VQSIEKLWRWLNQDVLHLHRQANDLKALRALVADFLAQFAQALLPSYAMSVSVYPIKF